ncbi:hypothetical protein ACTSKR_07545 [Chitinibacteraceae bacterium HSL-7]
MTDQFERASDLEQAMRDAALANQRAASQTQFRTECPDCEEPLEPHRQPYGICVPCKQDRETRDRQHRR